MLALTRRVGQDIVIGGTIRIRVLAVRGERVRLGVTAPATTRVDREEVHTRRLRQRVPSLLSDSEAIRQSPLREVPAASSTDRGESR